MWELVDPRKECNPVKMKRVYKTKLNDERNNGKYEERLVVKGDKQKEAIDYNY